MKPPIGEKVHQVLMNGLGSLSMNSWKGKLTLEYLIPTAAFLCHQTWDVTVYPRVFIGKSIHRGNTQENLRLKKNGSGVAQIEFEKADGFNGQFTAVLIECEHNHVPLLDRSENCKSTRTQN